MDIEELEDGISEAIKETTNEVFSTMLMMDVKAEDTFIKDEKNVSTDLISSLHFFGEKYMGKIAIFSSGAVSCHIANAMLGDDIKEVTEDIKDGMGEIVNMIAGGAKVKLLEVLGDIHLLTPWVIAGRHLTIASSEGGGELALDSQAHFSWVMTKFVFDKGTFYVGVQPNSVPTGNKISSDTNNEVEALKEENNKLKEEIERLKSLVDSSATSST